MSAARGQLVPLLSAALEMAEEHGIPIFPCRSDKKPYTAHGLKDASSNIEQIAQWWTHWPDALIAVPTGRASKLLVVDIDPAGAEWYVQNADRLKPGRVHKTRRGHHLLYRMPPTEIRNSTSKITPGVDVRGEGGYVVWWAAHGCEVIGDMNDIAEPPQWLVDMLTVVTATSDNKTTKTTKTNGNAIGQSRRNDTLSREAYRMRKQGATVEQIKIVLLALNEACCAPPLPAQEVEGIAEKKKGIEPEIPESIAFEHFYAVMPMHAYVFTPNCEMWPAASVNSRLPRVLVGDTEIKGAAWLDQNRPVEQLTWAPGEPQVVSDKLVSNGGWIHHKGVSCFNLYLPPQREPGEADQADPWIEHVQRVFGDDSTHIINWLAHRVQRPGEKINHALVLGGAQGIGKDTILEPVKHAIGPWNFSEVSPPQILGRFNGFLKSVILRVSEARDLGDFDRFGFYDHMKAITAAPPDVLRCDEKNIREHSVFNVTGVIITSNNKSNGVYLPSDDRRHYVAWSSVAKEDFAPDYWNRIYRWYAEGGIWHVCAYLEQLSLSDFDPKAPPPKTNAFWDIVDANRAPEDAELADVIDILHNPKAVTLAMLLQACNNNTSRTGQFGSWLEDRKNRRQIPHRLETAGYAAVRNPTAPKDGYWIVGMKRMAVYARAELSRSEQLAAAKAL
jgi:hypothetical protein